jgi:Domain of Unknown Function (DUF748)
MAESLPHKRSKISKKWKIIFGIVVVLIVIRAFLPYIVLHYANKRLAEMPGYYGHIEDLDLNLYRGAYTLKTMYLNKVDSIDNKQIPFFSSKVIDLSLEWPSLLHGRIVAKLEFETAVMRFTKDKVDPKKLDDDSSTFRGLIEGFMPLRINRFEVTNGKIQYIDPTTKPAVDISMVNTHVLATNLTNVADSTQLLPSTIHLTSDVYDGTFTFDMKLNPLLKDPTFQFKAELKNTNLAKLNPFLTSYAGLDVNRGNFSLYSEVAAKNGDYKGYVKPIIKDLKVLGPQDTNKSFLHKIYEVAVAGAAFVLTNHPKDQIATKIPLDGTFKKTYVETWSAIFDVLRNAFVQALYPSLDNDITINAVPKPTPPKTLWQKVFGGGDKKKK